MTTTAGISVNAYARLRGVSHTAVQIRIAEGALPTSAKRIKGKWRILDVERANQEWESHTRPRVAAESRPRSGAAPSALSDATLRERKARAYAIEIAIARQMRELVSAREVEQRWAAHIVAARTAMLGLPSRAKSRLPHLTGADLAVLDTLIRDALAELAIASPRATPSDMPVTFATTADARAASS